jgi:hypothetical protein
MPSIEDDIWTELVQLQTESIGWLPLNEGAYLHIGSDEPVIQVVGIAKPEMASSNVLWLT